MEELKQTVDFIQKFSASTIMTAVGLLLLYSAVKKLQAENPANVKWWKVLAVVGIVLTIGAQSLSVWNIFIARRVTAKQAFENLKGNSRVQWVMRLVPYKYPSTDGCCAVKQLASLGPPSQDYVFVADYEELKGYTVEQALYKIGGSLSGQKNRVSAVIFPLDRRDLFPANARGLLQVIQRVDDVHRADQGYRAFDIPEKYIDDLRNIGIESYAWDSLKQRYPDYRDLVSRFRGSDVFSAKWHIGNIAEDWHPLGYSMVIANYISTVPKSFSLESGYETVSAPKFGARAFLMKNEPIDELENVILCDFKTPATDKIPDIGGKSGVIDVTATQKD